jgi:hypothetical protein
MKVGRAEQIAIASAVYHQQSGFTEIRNVSAFTISQLMFSFKTASMRTASCHWKAIKAKESLHV